MSVLLSSYGERGSFVPLWPSLALVNHKVRKERERRGKVFHALMISGDSLIIYMEKELEGGAGGWDWSPRMNLIWVYSGLTNDTV